MNNHLVYKIISDIPAGKVSTYGQVAKIYKKVSGVDIHARSVGKILHNNPQPKIISCHRVVNHKGRVAESFTFGGALGQIKCLRNEGVEVNGGVVSLGRFGYEG